MVSRIDIWCKWVCLDGRSSNQISQFRRSDLAKFKKGGGELLLRQGSIEEEIRPPMLSWVIESLHLNRHPEIMRKHV